MKNIILLLATLLIVGVGCTTSHRIDSHLKTIPKDLKPQPKFGMYPFDLATMESSEDPFEELRKYKCYIRFSGGEYSEDLNWPISVQVNDSLWDQLLLKERIRFCTLILKAFPKKYSVVMANVGPIHMRPENLAVIRQFHGGYIRFTERGLKGLDLKQ